jgi:prepilin-type N-terminal cleavage/methylation domain-containing protein
MHHHLRQRLRQRLHLGLARRLKRGFTVAEILLVLAIMGIIGAVGTPMYLNLREAAEQKAAIAKANTLNAAMLAFRDKIADPDTKWTAASSDAAKFTLLVNNGCLPMASTSLTTYAPVGYTYAFSTNLITKVTLKKGTAAVAY